MLWLGSTKALNWSRLVVICALVPLITSCQNGTMMGLLNGCPEAIEVRVVREGEVQWDIVSPKSAVRVGFFLDDDEP